MCTIFFLTHSLSTSFNICDWQLDLFDFAEIKFPSFFFFCVNSLKMSSTEMSFFYSYILIFLFVFLYFCMRMWFEFFVKFAILISLIMHNNKYVQSSFVCAVDGFQWHLLMGRIDIRRRRRRCRRRCYKCWLPFSLIIDISIGNFSRLCDNPFFIYKIIIYKLYPLRTLSYALKVLLVSYILRTWLTWKTFMLKPFKFYRADLFNNLNHQLSTNMFVTIILRFRILFSFFALLLLLFFDWSYLLKWFVFFRLHPFHTHTYTYFIHNRFEWCIAAYTYYFDSTLFVCNFAVCSD